MQIRPCFDLALAYPQWQGSGRPENLARGAEATAAVCGRFAPLRRISMADADEAQDGVNRWRAIEEQFRSAQDILRETKPKRLLTAGGDCAVDIAVIDYLLRLYPDLTVIWVDAHLDANTPATSPSGNFHGMPVAAILGSPPAALAPYLGRPLDPSRFRYFAASVGDQGDWDFQKSRALAWLDAEAIIDGPVHIHFDLDVLDPGQFPFLAYPDGSLAPQEGIDLVRRIAASATLVGLTITEFAPANDSDAAQGALFIEQLCEAAHSQPSDNLDIAGL